MDCRMICLSLRRNLNSRESVEPRTVPREKDTTAPLFFCVPHPSALPRRRVKLKGFVAASSLSIMLAVFPAMAFAQPARFDTSLVSTFTVAALTAAARTGDSIADFRASNPATHARLTAVLARLDRPEVMRLPLSLVARPERVTGIGRQAGFAFVSRATRPSNAPGLAEYDGPALDTLAMLMAQELPRALEPILGEDRTDRLLEPLEAFNFARRNVSIAQSLEKLRRYERKYGPGSPRLNAVEVLLNYGAQWLPGFRPDVEGWPGALEVVASYVPTYLTLADGKGRAMSVAELGFRRYLWSKGFGSSVLKPGYVSLGLAVAGERDGAMTSPLRGKSRVGAFLGWGESKIAYVGGSENRVMITRQIQLVPWVF